MSDLGFSDAAVTLNRHLADKVLSVSWSFAWAPEFLALPVPPDTLSSVAPLGSLSFVALSLSLFILSILFILGFWVSRMARRLLFQRPFDAF
jgi:hypothetical protein